MLMRNVARDFAKFIALTGALMVFAMPAAPQEMETDSVSEPRLFNSLDVAIPRVLRTSKEKLVDNLRVFPDRFVRTAEKKKKRWVDGKRPKKGTGPGTYLSGGLAYIGTWQDYKLSGPFKVHFKGALVFDGIAEDGIVKSGVKYQLKYFFPLYSSSYTKDEFAAKIDATKGTYSVPQFSGNYIHDGTNKDGIARYSMGEGTEYFAERYPSGPPKVEFIRFANREKNDRGVRVLHGDAFLFQPAPIGSEASGLIKTSVIPYHFGTVHGIYEVHSNKDYILEIGIANDRVRTIPFVLRPKDGSPAMTKHYKHLRHSAKKTDDPTMFYFDYLDDEVVARIQARRAKKRAAEKAARDAAIAYYAAKEVERQKANAARDERRRTLSKHGTYEEGVAAFEGQNFSKAYRILLDHAGDGDGFSQNAIGRMYQNGWGVSYNNAEAVRWYQMAADQNYAMAQYNLGWMFFYNRVPGNYDNYASGVSYMKAAAKQGNTFAREYLADLEAAEEQSRRRSMAEFKNSLATSRQGCRNPTWRTENLGSTTASRRVFVCN